MNKKNGELLLSEYQPRPMLKRPVYIPDKAKFPVIDTHNHFVEDVPGSELLKVMDQVGVRMLINVTANTKFLFEENGYTAFPRPIQYFIENYQKPYPNRFACFTMCDFANLNQKILIKNEDFGKRCAQHLEEDVKKGAIGLKVTKELGLKFRDNSGKIIPVDDERLFPIWEKAGELGVPVLIHTSDPAAFFLPIDRFNEHYPTLYRAPDWSFYNSFYSKTELLAQRDRMIEAYPGTTFICPHVANYPEDLEYVSRFLEKHPNAYIDISARIDELGRQPYSSREFLIKYSNRVLFGTDMPVWSDVYRSYFRFLETKDEYFEYPDYIGRFGYCRWRIYGVNLPDEVLENIYYRNACKIIPGIKELFFN